MVRDDKVNTAPLLLTLDLKGLSSVTVLSVSQSHRPKFSGPFPSSLTFSPFQMTDEEDRVKIKRVSIVTRTTLNRHERKKKYFFYL